MTLQPKSDHGHTDADFLRRLRQSVEQQIAEYSYEVPEGSIGQPMSASAGQNQLAEMRSFLVAPYWVEVELRDTFEQVAKDEGMMRNCAVVADDGKGMLLLYDPVEEAFVLAQRSGRRLSTFGVRGDAVGCFFSR